MNNGDKIDEGYVKYHSTWARGPAPDPNAVALLNRWRRPLLAAGLIGHYADLNVGFGNISVRAPEPAEFIISGTQTGHIEFTSGDHYALVTKADIAANQVFCNGPIQASSEALTHAAIYRLSGSINAVVHVHSRKLWQRERDVLPTTQADIAYGTPQMAEEFSRLWQQTDFSSIGLAVMAGHDEGLVSIGVSLAEAAERILLLDRA